MAYDATTFSRVSTGYKNDSVTTVGSSDADLGFISGAGTALTISGNIASGTITAATALVVTSTTTPTAGDSTAVAGTFAYDDDYFYIATSANSWRRVAIAEY